MLVGAALFAVGWARQAVAPPNPQDHRAVWFTVAPGDTATGIAHQLQKRGLIRSALMFELWSRYFHLSQHLRAGVYAFAPSFSLSTVMGRLSHGDILTFRVTIPEGFTVRQTIDRLVRDHVGTKAALWRAVKAGIPGLTPPSGVKDPVEGFLFPDTYIFPAGMTARQVVLLMWQNFLRRTAALRPELQAQHVSLWHWVTLASIVQAEDSNPKDAPKIAAVFQNRLKVGMHLQSDATVRYALGQHVVGHLSYQDLSVTSAYNTYVHAGLPPGPIDCPGLVALSAALHPASVPYLYFLSLPNGTDLFATTYAQHLANIAKASSATAGP